MKKVVDKYKFIACDGAIFGNEIDCQNHETHLREIATAKALIADNPCIAIYIKEQMEKFRTTADKIAWDAESNCGYDRHIDYEMRSKAYSLLSSAMSEFVKHFNTLAKIK